MPKLWLALISVACLLACSKRDAPVAAHVVEPAPVEPTEQADDLPRGVAPPEPVGDEATADEPANDEPATEAPAPGKDQTAAKPVAAKVASAKPANTKPALEPPPTKPEAAAKPEPPPEPEAAKPAARKHTNVPSTAHVRISVPAGMQKLLDADSRMQPWVNQVVQVADRCFAKERAKGSSGGTIAVTVTMHPNARPTPDIDSLPPSLAGVMACATGDLARAPRMPLFTGPEGERHKLSIRFTP